MREDGYAGDAEGGFNLQSLGSMLQNAAPAAMQGAGAGAAFGPWGALIGGLGAGALSVAQQAQGPSPTAAPPPRPAVRPVPQAPPSFAAPAPSAAPPSPAPAPAPAFGATTAATPVATPATPDLAGPTAGAAPAAGGSFGQVLALLGNPQIQALIGSFASGQRPSTANLLGGASAAMTAFAPRASAAPPSAEAEADEDSEAANGGGAIGWLVASGVARQRA